MKIKKTNFKGLKIIQSKVHYDSRGFFKELYKKKLLNKHKSIFWCVSKSKKNVLRGLHLQTKKEQERDGKPIVKCRPIWIVERNEESH